MILIGANLAVLVVLVFAYPHLMVSPGPLLPGHAELTTDCFACHAPLRGAASARCVECHALPDIGLRSTQGVALPQHGLKTSFHQELVEQDCIASHSDHLGPRSTQRSRKPFSHALLRPAVQDRCDSCHQSPTDTLHRKISGKGKQCYSTQQWKPATFDHARLFVLDHDHNADCVTCHQYTTTAATPATATKSTRRPASVASTRRKAFPPSRTASNATGTRVSNPTSRARASRATRMRRTDAVCVQPYQAEWLLTARCGRCECQLWWCMHGTNQRRREDEVTG